MSSIYLEPADLVRRFIAFCVDGLIISLVVPLLIVLPLLVSYTAFEQFGGLFEKLIFYNSTVLEYTGSILIFLLSILYYTYLTSSFKQASLGQRLMNMYVIRLDQVKIKASFALMRLLVFWFGPSIASLCPISAIAFIFKVKNLFSDATTTITKTQEITLFTLMLVFFVIVYILLPAISGKNQTIHDMLCKTIVVKGRLKKAN